MKQTPGPPSFLLWLFKSFCRPSYHADIEGDLIEHYDRQAKDFGRQKANWQLLFNVIRLFRPGLVRSFGFPINPHPVGLFRHNLTLSVRNFRKYKTPFVINMVGLSTGLTCVLLIFLWVYDEVQMDQFHSHRNQLYQVLENRQLGDDVVTRSSTSSLTADALVTDFPEVEMAVPTTIDFIQPSVISINKTGVKAQQLFAGKDFFKMFSFDLIHGDPARVLSDKKNIVVSKSLAVRLFGTFENVMGKIVQVDHDTEFEITGLMDDISSHSSVQFDCVLSYEVFLDGYAYGKIWDATSSQTHVLLKNGTNVDEFNEKIKNLVRIKTEGRVTHRTPFVQRFSERYLNGEYVEGKLTGGRIEIAVLFSTIGGFILLIACINFMNLSTARALKQIKDIGVRKVIGASRSILISQVLQESILMASMASCLALIATWLLLPQFSTIAGKQLVITLNAPFVLLLIGIALITGVLAGSYPALYLSRFNPAIVLKGRMNAFFGEQWARKILVVFQFVVSISLIISVLALYKQIEFIQSNDLGYDKDNILIINSQGELYEKQETFLQELRKIPGVVGASASSHDMAGHRRSTNHFEWQGKDPNDHTDFECISAKYGLIELLGMRMKEGISFPQQGENTTKMIFNEAAIKHMGLTDPIGKQVSADGHTWEIIGVVEDFNFDSFREPIKPSFIFVEPFPVGMILAKLEGDTKKETIASIESLYKKFNPGFLFSYRFVDDGFQHLYDTESRISVLARYFAGLAILISCLGLFGLAAFTTERRLKEVGIRKVLGSSNAGIFYLLSGEFSQVVLIAIAIALPFSWYYVSAWLDRFVFRIELQWWYFAASGFAALAIAWLTVALQTYKATRINPADCLRLE
jgi:putative ABC transport system permease protein